MHLSRKWSHRCASYLCRRALFQFYLVHGDRDSCLPQRCRLAAAGEVQFEHLYFGRGEGEGGVSRICVRVGLLELVYYFILMPRGGLSGFTGTVTQ